MCSSSLAWFRENAAWLVITAAFTYASSVAWNALRTSTAFREPCNRTSTCTSATRLLSSVFIARQHSNADAQYWYSNSVSPSVRLSRSGIVSKRLKISSYFLQRMVAQSFQFPSTKHFFAKFRRRYPPRRGRRI